MNTAISKTERMLAARKGVIVVIVVKDAGDRAFVSGADISEFDGKHSLPETIASS